MDAQQIKPYTFWIVCGVIIVAMLGLNLYYAYEMTDENGRYPEDVKRRLDKDYQDLEGLSKRASNEPTGRYNAESKDDIEKLTNNYLLNPKWETPLKTAVNLYDQELEKIKQDLVERSKILHEPVSTDSEAGAWYRVYNDKTKKILSDLREAGALDVGPEFKEKDLETDNSLRARVGFYTKGDVFPTADQHPKLTTQFRIIEALTKAVLASGRTSLRNPIVQTEAEAVKLKQSFAKFRSFEWKANSDINATLSGQVGRFANAYQCTVTFEGPVSALVTAEAAIERLSNPVVVIVSAKMSARGSQQKGARKNKPDEPMLLTLTLAAIDFTKTKPSAADETGSTTIDPADPADAGGDDAVDGSNQ